jgi:hypothetical protein
MLARVDSLGVSAASVVDSFSSDIFLVVVVGGFCIYSNGKEEQERRISFVILPVASAAGIWLPPYT